MKGERRHELHQNDLLAWVNNVIQSVKPYSTLIALLAVFAAVAIGGWKWWKRDAATQAASAWDELFSAMNSGSPAQVNEVAELRPGSDVGHWAAVVAGDMYLDAGCRQLFRSKATAAQELRKAVEQYLGVLEQSRASALRERATFGLARAYEALAGTRQSEGELDKARQYYQELVSTWPEGAYATTAHRRLEDLERQDIKVFYDKFAQYDPQPAYSEQPLPEGERPSFDLDSLEEEKVPDFKALNLDLEESETEESPATGGDVTTTDEEMDGGQQPESTGQAEDGPPEASTTPPDQSAAGAQVEASDSDGPTKTASPGTPPADTPSAETPPAETPAQSAP